MFYFFNKLTYCKCHLLNTENDLYIILISILNINGPFAMNHNTKVYLLL